MLLTKPYSNTIKTKKSAKSSLASNPVTTGGVPGKGRSSKKKLKNFKVARLDWNKQGSPTQGRPAGKQETVGRLRSPDSLVVSKSQIVRNSDRKSNKSSKRRRGAKKGDQMGSHEIARENRGDQPAYEKAQTEAAVSEVQSVMIDLI